MANTASHYFMDTAATKRACGTELKLIEKNCKPEPQDPDKPKKKKSGLSGKISTLTEVLDAPGKASALYNRDKSTSALDGNAWMDDGCSGQWITPINDNKNFPSDLKEKLESFSDKLDMGMLDKMSMMKDSIYEIASIAKEFVTPQVVEGIVTDFATKSAIKAGVGLVGGETVIIPILMGAWTAYDALQTANQLAALAGDKGKAALEAFKSIANIGDEAEKIVDQIEKEPAKAYTNAMELMAKLDPCVRARKCLLVKYRNTEGSPKAAAQASHGRGCCPGQTGHHILPDSMVADAGCPGYDKKDAPVMCLEGTSNNAGWGSHGGAHQNLKEGIKNYRLRRLAVGQSPNTISYNDAANQGIDAVRDAAAGQCDKDCLRAQLDEYYDCKGKDLKATDGTGPMSKMPEPPVLPKPNTNVR